jgi:two-component system, NtrC family, sensor kinase
VAHHNQPAEALASLERAYPMRPGRAQVSGRAILSRAVAEIHDVRSDPEYLPGMAAEMELGSLLAVPMLRADGTPTGVIVIQRSEAGPFATGHVELLKTFADQAVIAIENVRLFKELEARNRDLTESLEQQTATSEILRVISSSPTDVQPVFDAIAAAATTLCAAENAGVFLYDGTLIHFAAHHKWTAKDLEAIRRAFPRPPGAGTVTARAILTRAVVHTTIAAGDPAYELRGFVDEGVRTILSVPMLRDGDPIGAISVTRREALQFTDRQIALLQTFADQAVIAIENVRLFKELQEKNRALTEAHAQVTEALEQQTATSEILRVISSSPTDLQPVAQAIADSASRLCDCTFVGVFGFDGELIHWVAARDASAAKEEALRASWPRPADRETLVGRTILAGETLHIHDVASDPTYGVASPAIRAALAIRSFLGIPMLRNGQPVGVIGLNRTEVRPFSERDIALLQTFADQAVIAIENVRLFKELEVRNRDLTEALEQQTATAEILRVISSSQTDVQPVFDTIVRSAVRLCAGLFSALFQFDGELIHFAAEHNYTPEALEAAHRVFPAHPTRALGTGRAILERAVVHIPDVEVDPEYQHQSLARAIGHRSGLYVPMLREGAPIGVIWVARAEAGPFSDSEIELLKTFADQAVIAVENVRLFKELQARTGELTQSVEQLTALGEVSRAVSSTLDVETVLDTIVSRASQLAGAAGCSIYEYDEGAEQFELRATHNYDAEFVEAIRAAPLRKGEGLMGRAAEMREPVQIPDITQPGAYQSSHRDTLVRFGYRALLSVPLLREDQIIGSLSFNRKAPGEFPPDVVDVLKTFATQSALAIQNARLFREIADKSAQLEAASRHKSEFLANMSHELRTPLNAVIGFSEVLLQRMFGALNAKQDEYLKDIYASGQHLLSLINDILDLSKIEAGRMELAPAPFHLPTALENAITLVRERATRHGIALQLDLDPRLGEVVGDERKVKQILLNLLSNAVKFTPEGGRISLRAGPRDGAVEISVTDTGIGIAPEDQGAIFEEFRQVGSDETRKQEGTGLGLTLAKKFVELHGGRIWVESKLGSGATFTFTLPMG